MTTFHALFEAQAARHGDAIALRIADREVSYAELNARANRLACYLLQRGIRPGAFIGVCLDRGVELITSLLAIFKAGAVYLPLDPDYPESRLRFMIEDSGVALVLTERQGTDRTDVLGSRALHLDEESPRIAEAAAENLDGGVTGDDLAYVIYTSGSTGQPKGALLAHRGLCNVVAEQQALFDLGPGSRVLQWASPNFDASLAEITMSLGTGATLVLAPAAELQPGPALGALLREQRVTICTLPPSSLTLLPPEPLPDLRILAVAGEPCPASLVTQWAANREMYNLYGPTECTIWATAARCEPDGQAPSIGRAIANVQVHVLDEALNRVPPGTAGELYIGGIGVGVGYLNRPELTAERFIPDPFSQQPGARLYRTGDLVRARADGALDFIGRVDHQIKVRGYRIEPGEIEAALETLPEIRQAIVTARGAADDRRLVAYVRFETGDELPSSEIRKQMRALLPSHMIPGLLVPVEDFPITPNGKVDRLALPDPLDTMTSATPEEGDTPRGLMEEAIAAVWRELLGVERVGRHDKFFELGGHSLLAIRVVAEVERRAGLRIPVRDLFFRSVAQLAQGGGGGDGVPAPGQVVLGQG